MDSGTWWPQELSTAEEMGAARKRLAEAAYGVDYICTHEPPAQTALFLDQSRSDPDGLETFFDTLTRATQFQRWFFGAMHRDKAVGSRFLAVFEQVHPLR